MARGTARGPLGWTLEVITVTGEPAEALRAEQARAIGHLLAWLQAQRSDR